MMGTAMIKRSWVALLLLVTLGSCEPDIKGTDPVVSDFKANPATGLTTTRFSFDATESLMNATDEDPVLVRYDWQSDGIWDQDYTTNKVIQHRFLKPGSYRIIMEARNMFGVKDTSSTTVEIAQGYSPPVVDLAVLPDTGNIYVLFTLNASRSYDDEDSSWLLKYRWDFDGDGSWDTEYSPNAVVTHAYPTLGWYNAGVEVVDPTNRSAVMKKMVVVNMLNDSIIPEFTIDGGFCTVTDTFHCDASASHFLNHSDKKLTYSWDVYNDDIWDATDLTTPYYPALISKSGKNKIRLRVKDDRGLYMDVVDSVKVFQQNNLPVPVLTLARRVGNLQSEFVFHSYGTLDRETQIMDMKYDWDVDGDGQWEPEFHNIREISYKYPKTGKYKVSLKVTDAHEDFVVV
ncbi:MAG: PKD domain-containing protein, partial [Bacteroidales bacterium]|nr:PKD domain-containing protein [Bacteroidales bacterium]